MNSQCCLLSNPDFWILSGAYFAGVILGFFYFGFLWLTVRRLHKIKNPGLLVIGGFFVRTAILIIGFWFVGGGNWQRFAIAVVGFITARIVLVRKLGMVQKKKPPDVIAGTDKNVSGENKCT